MSKFRHGVRGENVITSLARIKQKRRENKDEKERNKEEISPVLRFFLPPWMVWIWDQQKRERTWDLPASFLVYLVHTSSKKQIFHATHTIWFLHAVSFLELKREVG